MHVSTDYVFDGKKKTPYLESDVTAPVNVYGLTKLAAEFHALSAPFVTVVRTSWLFGAGQPRNFVNAVRERLQGQGLSAWDIQTTAFDKHIRDETVRWAKVIKDRNITME